MGPMSGWFRKPTLERVLRRARRLLAAGDFERARQAVTEGFTHYPGADALRDLELSIRQGQASADVRQIRERILNHDDPRAYEALIAHYLEVGMRGEALKEARAYATAHPDRDVPHLLLGELHLQSFLQRMQARDAHVAVQRLRRAAALNAHAMKPRLLLAELYYCVGADRSLHTMLRELEEISPEDPLIETLAERVRRIDEPFEEEPIDGLFARIEVQGQLTRASKTWPAAPRRLANPAVESERVERTIRSLVNRGAAAEVVILERSGEVVAHAEGSLEDEDPATTDQGLVDVARVVAQTVSRYAHDLDLGSFRRCTIQGPFGLVAVGEVAGLVAGARWRQSPDPSRLWDRVAVDLEDLFGGSKA